MFGPCRDNRDTDGRASWSTAAGFIRTETCKADRVRRILCVSDREQECLEELFVKSLKRGAVAPWSQL